MTENSKNVDLALPLHERPFKQRVRESWENFLKEEATLRQLIHQKAESEAILQQLDSLLSPAFDKVYAEVGFNGEKYDLILNLEGDWSRLFPLTYFKEQAPKEVYEHWNILVGRQSREEELSKYQVRIWGESVGAEDIKVWTVWNGQSAKVSVYSEKLVPLLKEKESEAYWIAYIMLDHAIGELAEMNYISELELLKKPYWKKSLTLEKLLPHMMEKLSLTRDELFDDKRYCQLYSAYQMEPVEDAYDGLRRDVFAGSSCFVPLVNEFLGGDTRIMDNLNEDGIVAGYFCYPLNNFEGSDRGARILDFRDNTVNLIESIAGADSFTYIGGASGIYYGYIDFIAWDLKAVLDAAVSVFKKSGLDWAMFHSFRQDVDGVTLFEK